MNTQTENQSCRLASSHYSTWSVIRAFLAEESPSKMLLMARALEQDERVLLVGSAMVGPRSFTAASSVIPDLVVMDEHFAGVDCAELARRLKQLPNPPRVFIVSSKDETHSQSRSLAAGADSVLVNGSNLPHQIQAAIQTFFGQAKIRVRGEGTQTLTNGRPPKAAVNRKVKVQLR